MTDWPVSELDIEKLEALVADHRKLEDQPLVLAMLFDSGSSPHDLFLLEVIENLGANEVGADRELFEVTYPFGQTASAEAKNLHLVLTNPEEFRTALRERWESAEPIQKAVTEGRFMVLYTREERTSDELIHA